MSHFQNRKPISRRRLLVAGSSLAAGLALPLLGRAQANASWPNRPIKLIVGFAPGGVTDGLPRLYAAALSERLGVPVVIENKVGAAGNIATAFAAKSAPDGYNLLASGVGQIVVLPHTSPIDVNPMTDLVHIAMVGDGDQILNIAADVPAKNLAEFVAYVKKNPGKVFWGDAGAGGNQHLYLEYFRSLAGLDMQAVHYKGGAPMLADLLTNRVQISLNAPSVVEPHIAAGKLRPIMILGKKRNPKMPEVPTAAEAGFPQMEACSNWLGLHAPKGTPDAIVQRIHKALADAMQSDAVKAGLEKMGVYSVMNTPQQFSARIASDYELFGKVVKASNIKAE
jgi:tripartite-type tricarboxylate transporter receptor subunit TctC